MADVRLQVKHALRMDKILKSIFSRKNLYALLLCLAILLIIILTADEAPQWIYQGF
jgi:hypothetical protein